MCYQHQYESDFSCFFTPKNNQFAAIDIRRCQRSCCTKKRLNFITKMHFLNNIMGYLTLN